MKNSNKDSEICPLLYSCDSIITGVNKEFIVFTGFTKSELVGKSLLEIGNMIRINTQILLDNISDSYLGYIFTKSLSVREVNISLYFKSILVSMIILIMR